jgi:hypothetical protein
VTGWPVCSACWQTSIAILVAAAPAHYAQLTYAPTALPKQTPLPLAETSTRADDVDQPLDLLRVPF